jgi:Zn finger protein HypA/HybF involved in hydrogenase expression
VPKKKLNLDSPGAVAAEAKAVLETAKQAYKTADAAMALLLSQVRIADCPECGAHRFKNNGIVKSSDGRAFRIVDKFAERDMVNVGMNARRYELEEVAAP